jgi:hypothetical protein
LSTSSVSFGARASFACLSSSAENTVNPNCFAPSWVCWTRQRADSFQRLTLGSGSIAGQ